MHRHSSRYIKMLHCYVIFLKLAQEGIKYSYIYTLKMIRSLLFLAEPKADESSNTQ